MRAVEVIDGSCGFRTHITAHLEDTDMVGLTVSSECEAVTRWGHQIARVDWRECIGRNPMTSRLWQSAMEILRHRSCPVLAAVLRAIETEVGATLPADIQIRFLSGEKSSSREKVGRRPENGK